MGVKAVAYPGGFSGCPETPPGHDFFLIRGFTSLHAPTFTSHLNLRLLETPLETNSGYATARGRFHRARVATVTARARAVDASRIHGRMASREYMAYKVRDCTQLLTSGYQH